MGAVKSFKIAGGDEIVAEVIDEIRSGLVVESAQQTVSAWVVRRPHALKMQPMGSGQVGLAFIPWTLSNPTIERMQIPASIVSVMFDPSDQVEKQYLQQTSGISLVG